MNTRQDSGSRRIISQPTSRRAAVIGGAAGLAGVLSARRGFAQGATPVVPEATPTGEGYQLLFVQEFQSSTVTPTGNPGELAIVLEQGTGLTIYFSDRPNRVVGTIETGRFIDEFRRETADDPANAAFVAQVSPTEEVTHVVELLDMEYFESAGALTYTARLLSDPSQLDILMDTAPLQEIAGPVTYQASQMFIDAGGLMQLVAYGAQDVPGPATPD